MSNAPAGTDSAHEAIDRSMKKSGKDHGVAWWLAVFLGLMLLPWVLLLGWMGLVPGVSNLMGARTPENLGVRYSNVDLKQFEAKTGIPLLPSPPAPPAQPPAAGAPPPPPPPQAPKPLDLTVSQEELSAVINQIGAGRLPLKKVQVKLGAGYAEISGALDGGRLGEFLRSVGVRPENSEKIAGWVKTLGNNIPVYLQAAGGVQGGQLDLQLQSLRLGNFEIPGDQINRLTGGGIHSNLAGRENYSVETLTLEDGALKFTGRLPPDWLQRRP